ncbi:MAG: phenylalanine--tRNA ligase subunit beta [Porticoccaceae bacterium]|nr:phenylalanine--tRNA ligase subunit beta [Porticoccaceae bacterium]
MKFSESWLREWVNPSIETDELVSRITMAGLEVDAVEPAAEIFSGVVVGEIISAEQHPDADKLRVCQVMGAPEGVLQVVCGAANARPGIKIPFATIGAVLPGDFKIKRAKLRGVESFGMLCAEKELGVSDNDEGLWELPADAPVGTDLRAYFGLDDNLIEVDLTPNRGDCLSIKGLAREVGVLCAMDVTPAATEAVPPVVADRFPVKLLAGNACPRYVGRVIRNINIGAESPLWLVEKLRRSGIRTIDPVVDVTNYVMLELGQPMHAFDLARLNGGIQVRLAGNGEKIRLLDGSEQKLTDDTLVIGDDNGVLAMAGIMGGEGSGVSAETRDIFLESAFFSPLAIVGRARKYGLHTDSSHRFERGVDPELCLQAMERATRLLVDIVGGEPGAVICEELRAHLPQPKLVTLSKERLAQQLALHLDSALVGDIFTRLGLIVESEDSEQWRVLVPSWRFDIAIPADLVEEVARIYGYNRLPTSTFNAQLAIRPSPEKQLDRSAFKSTLVNRGFNEVITYSFVDPKLMATLDSEGRFVDVANPISSDMAVMRTSLWAGLVDTLKRNLSRQQNRVSLFETGLRFIGGDELVQEPMIAGLIYGEREEESWTQARGKVDFYDIKGHVQALANLCACEDEFRYEAASHSALHPGQCAALYRRDRLIGYLGRIHPSVQKQLDLDQPAFMFELSLSGLDSARIPRYKGISRYPEVRRDIAVIVDKAIAVSAILNTARAAAGSLLVDIRLFDVYEGKGIENNRKSVALGLTYQEQSRTLNESEVTASVDEVIASLKTNYQATLRG